MVHTVCLGVNVSSVSGFRKNIWRSKQAHLFTQITCLVSLLVLFVPATSTLVLSKVVFIRLAIYVFVNKARGGGSPKFFINVVYETVERFKYLMKET